MKLNALLSAAMFAALTCPALAADDLGPPAGTYVMDLAHTSLIFRVNHLGFSNYTARFTKVEGTLKFDPKKPQTMSVTATIDPKSLETDYPLPNLDFDAELTGTNWLNAAKFPTIEFKSTEVELLGKNTAYVHGNLTLHGVTLPVILKATYNGGYSGHPMDPNGRIGFSARGSLDRSKFGIAYGVPAKGTTMGVSDAVDVIIETEFKEQKPK
jgi:polyisoprenoid-binding protein YceI